MGEEQQRIGRLREMLATNSTATSFASKIATTTEPTSDGVHIIGHMGGPAPRWLHYCFFGTNAADETFNYAIIGWRLVSTLWVPVWLHTATVTLGTGTGVAGAAVLDTDFFADTIASASGSATADIYSPADNRIAWVSVEAKGFEKVEFIFDLVTAASANGLFTEF